MFLQVVDSEMHKATQQEEIGVKWTDSKRRDR